MAFEVDSLKIAIDEIALNSGGKAPEIKTNHSKCPICGGQIKLQERSREKGDLMYYSETGQNKLTHLEYRCEEKHCRTGLFYGYVIKKGGQKIYEKDCLTNPLLVVSRKTAFSIPWLYSATLKIYHYNATFDRLAAEYNDYLNFG